MFLDGGSLFEWFTKQVNFVASFFFLFLFLFFFRKLEIIAYLVATWFHENWKLTVVVNVKFTISGQFNFVNMHPPQN